MHINACSVLLHRTGWLKPITIPPPHPPKLQFVFHLAIQKCRGQKVAASSRDQGHQQARRGVAERLFALERGPNTQRPGPTCLENAHPPNILQFTGGGLREHCDPTDTLTGVDGRICKVGDAAAGLWNEYGWSRPAAEGQTVGR